MQTIRNTITIVPFLTIALFCNGVSNKKERDLPDSPFTSSLNITDINTKAVAGKRALLIGINDYPYVSPKLHGCVNDVQMMRSLLIRKYHFQAELVTILLNEKATRTSMLKAFHDLIAATKVNDTVIIYYSGHGSQISNPEETDGLDETIIPYDYRDSPYGKLPITDKQISNILAKLSKKTSNITVILDCCHSGGATKDLLTGTEKEIPKDSRKMPAKDDFLSVEGRSLPTLRDSEAKYVLLAGCRSDQKSYETKSANGIYGGMLTLSLVDKLSSATGKLTWPAVVEDLQTHIRQFYNQTPELVGLNKSSYVFGSTYAFSEAYFTIQPGSSNVITVDGGKAQNVTVGSTYKVYPPGTLHFNTESIGVVQITKVSDFSAQAKVINGRVLQPNCRAVEYKHKASKDEKIFVAFLGDWKGSAVASIKKKMLALSNTVEDSRYPNIIYYNKGDKIITYSGRDTVHDLEVFALSQGKYDKELISSVVRWNKWFRVANIKNPASKLNVTLAFEKSKDISLDKADINFKSGITISFNLKNNSRVPVYVYVLDLTDNGDIEVYTLDDFKISGQSVSEAIPAGASVSCAMKPAIRPGQSLTRDILKIFFSSVPTDFKSLKQDHSKAFEEGDSERSLDPINKQIENVTDWATIEKVIFVTP